VGSIFPRTLVRYVHLPLSTPIERTVQIAVRRLWHCSPGVSLRSIFNASCIGHLMSHGIPSLDTFSSFSVTLQRHHPSAYRRPALWMTSSQSSRATFWQLQVTSKQLCSVAC
jgi:hypothetical protein